MKMKHTANVLLLLLLSLVLSRQRLKAAQSDTLRYTLDFSRAGAQIIDAELSFAPARPGKQQLHIPRWSPGYYQLMDYAASVQVNSVKNGKGESLHWSPVGKDSWEIEVAEAGSVHVSYSVSTGRSFVALNYADSNRVFIKPAATFFYLNGELSRPVRLQLGLENGTVVATGLEPVSMPGARAFKAKDMDELYDSPLLIGRLDSIAPMDVYGVPHRFMGYKLGSFDEEAFRSDLSSILRQAVDLFGDIPFKHYTFIGIGPGQGGIEQKNSTAVAFSGQALNGPGRKTMLSFLAHEYFHHYNVKRIRPLELDTIDYQQPVPSRMLWISEGLTVYYEAVLLHRAGILSRQELIQDRAEKIQGYENNPGRFHQTLAESSEQTWQEGPFGKPESGKTISYYEKGPIVGLLLDVEIRSRTENKKSLDDLMRLLYRRYYKEKGRGFSEAEFRSAAEEIAGGPLDTIFDYVYSLKQIDYTVLEKAGLSVRLQQEQDDQGIRKTVKLEPLTAPSALQKQIFESLFGRADF